MSGRVRDLFAGDAIVALEVCDTRDFDGTLAAAKGFSAAQMALL